MSLLIINAELVNPPSTIMAFRDLTLFCTIRCDIDIVLECEKDHKDLYFKYLKKYGALDFVKDILYIDEEFGIRLDTKNRKPPTIVVNRIIPENTWLILNRITGKKIL